MPLIEFLVMKGNKPKEIFDTEISLVFQDFGLLEWYKIGLDYLNNGVFRIGQGQFE